MLAQPQLNCGTVIVNRDVRGQGRAMLCLGKGGSLCRPAAATKATILRRLWPNMGLVMSSLCTKTGYGGSSSVRAKGIAATSWAADAQ